MADKAAATYHPHNTLEETLEAKRMANYERDITEPQQALIDRIREQFPDSQVTRYECPMCGWHVSAHAPSSFTGTWDCPNGASPALKEGRIWGIRATPYWIGMMRREGVTITLSFPSRFGNRNYESLGPFPMNWPAQLEVPNETPQPKRHRRRNNRAGTNDRSS